MSGPNSDPRQGVQTFRTPTEFLRACERKFGVTIGFDLACTREDAVCEQGFFHPEHDALALAWPTTTPQGPVAFCNPPYAKASSFARVASESPHCRTLMLVPASVGTAWFAEYVHGRALVCFLRPRLTFLQPDGTPMPQGINRDLMLLGYGWAPGVYVCEDWREW
jgi:phage N-6-adenine-methyltransferase